MAEGDSAKEIQQSAIENHFERATSSDLSKPEREKSAEAFHILVKASKKKPEEVLRELMFGDKKKP